MQLTTSMNQHYHSQQQTKVQDYPAILRIPAPCRSLRGATAAAPPWYVWKAHSSANTAYATRRNSIHTRWSSAKQRSPQHQHQAIHGKQQDSPGAQVQSTSRRAQQQTSNAQYAEPTTPPTRSNGHATTAPNQDARRSTQLRNTDATAAQSTPETPTTCHPTASAGYVHAPYSTQTDSYDATTAAAYARTTDSAKTVRSHTSTTRSYADSAGLMAASYASMRRLAAPTTTEPKDDGSGLQRRSTQYEYGTANHFQTART